MLGSAKKSVVILIYLCLAISALLVFWRVCNFDFINYDDNDYVYENQHVLSGLNTNNVIWAFTTNCASNWHPLTWLSLMLDCQLFGLNPGWMHSVNLFFHIVNTLLLFTVLIKMTDSLWPSAFVAALFAIHPAHVESVAWIAERKDVLSTFFLLLTFTAYVGYVKRQSRFLYLLAILLFAIGILAKPMLVTLPFLLLLLDYWPLNRFAPQTAKTSPRQDRKSARTSGKVWHRILIEKIPFFALSLISSMITFFVQRGGGAVIGINVLPFEHRIANVSLSYVRYIGKMFWPQNLAVIHLMDRVIPPFWQIAACILLLIVISALVIKFGSTHKYLPVGWFWFVAALIPVIGIVQAGLQGIAERYTYIPYIGLFIIIAWGLPELISKWPSKKILLGISMPIVLTILAVCAYRQVGYWKNSAALFSHVIEVTQDNYRAYFNLAEDYRRQGKTAQAIEYYKKTLQISPDFPDAVFVLGCVWADKGDSDQAIAYFQRTLQLEPASVHAALANHYLGMSLQKQGKLAQAIVHFNQCLQIMPDFDKAHNDLANTLLQQGNLDEAADQFRAAIRIQPDWFEPVNNLAFLIATRPELKNRDINEAITLASRACRLTNYSDPVSLGTLAAAYAAAGKFSDAIDTVQKAIKLAEAANQPQLKNILQNHLTIYMQNKSLSE